MQDTCGYGALQSDQPLIDMVWFSPFNPALQQLPVEGCGSCWELVCRAGKQVVALLAAPLSP